MTHSSSENLSQPIEPHESTESTLPHLLHLPHSSLQTECKQDISNRIAWIIAILLFLGGLAIRFYDITDPPLDFHGTRQLRSALIARNMFYQGMTDTDPEIRQLAKKLSVITGQYEPPILERLVSWAYLLIGREILWVSRLFTSIFWIIGGLALFDLTRRMTNNLAALISLGYYLFLPFAVQASRSFQPDPGMVMWMILGIYSLYRWQEKSSGSSSPQWLWAILAGLFAGMAILTKVIVVYIIGLFAVVIVAQYPGLRRAWRNPQVWTMAILMILPILLFYMFGREARATEYFQSWSISLSHLLLDPTQYIRWFNMLVELMGLAALVLSIIGVSLATYGNTLPPRNGSPSPDGSFSPRPLLLALMGGYILYGLTLPYQMATHSYYHLQLVPILALSFSHVIPPIQERISVQRWVWKTLAVCGVLTALGFFLWTSYLTFKEEDFRNAPAFWSEIGSQLPTDGKVVGLTQDYGFPLAYYGWRKVTLWPIVGERQLDNLRGKGKTFEEYFLKNTKDKRYFLITAFNQLDRQPDLQGHLEQNYPIFAQDENFIIYNLNP